MNPCELTTLLSGIACTIFRCYPPEDLAVIAASFTQLGDSLATMLAHEERCKNSEKELP